MATYTIPNIAEPILAVNLGTGTPEEASFEIEYTNMEGGTYFSDLRKENGYEKPHNIKMWCLGKFFILSG